MLNQIGSITPTHTTSEGFLLDSLARKAILPEVSMALNAISSPVLITDTSYTITFANRCSLHLAEKLGICHLLGANLSEFYSSAECLPHSFVLHVVPLRNTRGECTGAFVDWEINAQQHAHQHRLENVICLNA